MVLFQIFIRSQSFYLFTLTLGFFLILCVPDLFFLAREKHKDIKKESKIFNS